MAVTAALGAQHCRRLRDIWRSAGWPCRDAVELDLLAAAMLESQRDASGRETLRLTEAGLQCLAAARRRNRAAFDAHEALVERVAREMQRGGRIVWRGLRLRAPLRAEAGDTKWVLAMPDLYSIRHTTAEDSTEPVVHEIKVSRADLLADRRRADKGAAYLALASQCWYVLKEGIAEADEVPADYGVMFAGAQGLQVARPAPTRPMRIPFDVWMGLVRGRAEPPADDDAQGLLAPAEPSGGPTIQSFDAPPP
jgi:hypothetical protein